MKLAKIALGIVAGALLLVGGAMSVETNIAIDQATSTFTKSTFDYIVVSPDNDQVATFTANTEAVSAIFPTYHYESTLTGASSAKLHLLLSDRMADYDISFFNPKRIVKGEYKEDGLMLDEVAAQKLGAQVGSSVSFTLGASKFALPVSAIYSAVNYQTMSTGVAMAKFTPAMANSWGEGKGPKTYELAFIAAKDITKCIQMLQSYKPMGQLMTYEEYKTEWAALRQPGEYTDEEWEAKMETGYAAMKSNFLKQDFVNAVQAKAVYMQGAEDTVSTRKDRGFQLTMLFSILVPLALAGGLIAFDFLGRNRDEAEKTNGKTKEILRKTIIIFDLIAVGAALVVSLGGTLIYSAIRGHIFVDSLLIYSLPILAALAIALPIGMVYSNLVYGKRELAPETQEIPAEEPVNAEKPEE